VFGLDASFLVNGGDFETVDPEDDDSDTIIFDPFVPSHGHERKLTVTLREDGETYYRASALAGETYINVAESAWRENDGYDDPKHRLLSSHMLTVNGASMHLEALEVATDSTTGEPYFTSDPQRAEEDGLFAAICRAVPLRTMTLFVRQYVFIASPHLV